MHFGLECASGVSAKLLQVDGADEGGVARVARVSGVVALCRKMQLANGLADCRESISQLHSGGVHRCIAKVLLPRRAVRNVLGVPGPACCRHSCYDW